MEIDVPARHILGVHGESREPADADIGHTAKYKLCGCSRSMRDGDAIAQSRLTRADEQSEERMKKNGARRDVEISRRDLEG